MMSKKLREQRSGMMDRVELCYAEGMIARGVARNGEMKSEVVGYAIVRTSGHDGAPYYVARYSTSDDQDSQLNHILSGAQPGDVVDARAWDSFQDQFLILEAAKKYMKREIVDWRAQRELVGYTIHAIGWKPSKLPEDTVPKDRFDDDHNTFKARLLAKRRAREKAALGKVTLSPTGPGWVDPSIDPVPTAEDLAEQLVARMPGSSTRRGNYATTPRACPIRDDPREELLWKHTPTPHGGKFWGARVIHDEIANVYRVMVRNGAFGSTGQIREMSNWIRDDQAWNVVRDLAANKLKAGYQEA